MGQTSFINTQIGTRIRAERQRHNWSQDELAARLGDRRLPYGLDYFHRSAIAKIEAGTRSVRPEELAAFADLFRTSIDALLGRSPGGSDLAWAVSKLTSSAQKMAGEVSGIRARLMNDAQDVHHYADDFHANDIKEATYAAASA
jgi:transcriptional regulator with XRE-family HTH domain